MDMRHSSNKTGLTILQSLIFVAILGILAAVVFPTYFSYSKKTHFADVIKAATPFKSAVESCYQSTGAVTNCTNGANGIPAAPAAEDSVASITTTAGVITATGQNKAGKDTYILTPTVTNKVLSWNVSGSCVESGIC